MKSKVDSMQQVLNSKNLEYLRFQDSFRGLSLNQYEAKKIELERTIRALSLAFGEALKNLEISDFSVKNATPFFQIIDSPLAPLSPSYSLIGLMKNLILGGFLGGFLSVAWVIGRKIFREVIEDI
jgi:uncharacterized protein involved in exopolysaccharide biosynthesis